MAKAKEVALWCVLIIFCIQVVKAGNRAPIVQVFTRHPVEFGKENTVQCYVDRFHPPKINITLLKDRVPMESQQSDLSFHNDWAFHRLVYANTIMDKSAVYSCRVEHETLPEPKIHNLETY